MKIEIKYFILFLKKFDDNSSFLKKFKIKGSMVQGF